jgi:lysozyme family protein
MTFDEAFTALIGHEGGYSNHPADKGGETMWGITEAVARQNGYMAPMKDMGQSYAKIIYRKLYWDAVRAEELPADIRFNVFDAAVNSGTGTAIRWLQQSVGEKVDGVLGSLTVMATRQKAPHVINARFNGIRLLFMTTLPSWNSFGKGWARRIATNLIEA